MSLLNPTRRLLLQGVSAAAMAAVALLGIRRAMAAGKGSDPIEDLIANMSIEEKAGQLSLFGDPTRFHGTVVNPTSEQAATRNRVYADIAAGRITGLFNGIGVAGGREMQKIAVEKSPRGIPLIFAGDIIHGFKTTFPIPLAEAASFDPDLAFRTARAAALEATAVGLHWTFAPMVDVARDQRWGRNAEGSGEDTFLGSQFAAARVLGFQGSSLKDETSLLACPKHFAAYGAVQGGMEYNTADIPETTLRQTHLPPFKAAFDAGALSTMSAFNDIAGVPATGNHYLLTDILRGEWGFRGLVVSDYTSEEELIAHGFAANGADATARAINAGCDVAMQSGLYNDYLPDLVKSGAVSMATVDEAVRRVLRVKQALGLFDNPYRSLDEDREQTDLRKPETLALAREAGRKSIVLLKNEGGLLPLSKSARIALIGPCINDKYDYPGPWSVFPDVATCVTMAEGFQAVMGGRGTLTMARGSDYELPYEGGIDEAVRAAEASDVVVLVIGESAGMSGEAQSRVDIGIPDAQLTLAEAVAATGKPVVVVLRHGRALALTGAAKAAPAILATWFLGSETGHSVADIIFGDYAPQGRLPVSFPQASGQEPYYYNHRATGRPQTTAEKDYKARYREVTNEGLYPFGHGLTYGDIVYGTTMVDAARLSWNGAVEVRAAVSNRGTRPAHEVAQLYIHDRVASLTQPVRALKGFSHIDLAPGETRTVSFTLRRSDLEFMTASLQFAAEPGLFDVWIAPSAVGGISASFELTS
ncbi:beta-glucosidase [Kaistia hirudinis]|uniref:beta-glucosidase n=1 Tax=Kaistia hirudinis TaxID=1293440 RepID=A0A840ASX2_9HYPH|nr:glycoside hydrolase family 3 N-terminal domain-containing protein [Kaistia hirudinis]MBB3933500.1 beta-glucosidase [Kaistia hirudinis]